MVQELLQRIQVKRIILEINPLKHNTTMPLYMCLIVFEDYGEVTSEITSEALQKPSYRQENKPGKQFFKLTFWREFVLTDLQRTGRLAVFILKIKIKIKVK